MNLTNRKVKEMKKTEQKTVVEAKTETRKWTRKVRTFFFYSETKGFLQTDYKFGNGSRLNVDNLKNAEMVKGMVKAAQGVDVDVLEKVL